MNPGTAFFIGYFIMVILYKEAPPQTAFFYALFGGLTLAFLELLDWWYSRGE